jgi:excisionase family DNA binding protein
MDEWLVTAGAAAQMLGISPSTFRVWVNDGLLPVASMDRGHRLFRHEDVRKLGLLISQPERCFKRNQIEGERSGREAPVKRRK